MRDAFKIKRNDTLPQLLYQLKPSSLDLTGATVVFNMKAVGGALKVNRGAAVVVATNPPQVGYNFTAGNTNTAGSYEGEFEVTFQDGKVGTFPNKGYISIEIDEDLG